MYNINHPPPPPHIPHWPVLSCVKVNHACCLSEFFKFLLHHLHIHWFKKKAKDSNYWKFFFRKILSWIIYYVCVCCNLKQYIYVHVFSLEHYIHETCMYACHSNAKYSHYIIVRLFLCIFSWKIFFVYYYFLFCLSK